MERGPTPAVLGAAALVGMWQGLRQALVILVAGCPCALLGAAPFVQGCALAVLASRHKLLVKRTTALEALARVQAVCLDKTGTITKGHFSLVEMVGLGRGHPKEIVHRWAAAVEQRDAHPLAKSIVASFTGCLGEFMASGGSLPEVTEFKRHGRTGVSGACEGHSVGVGNDAFTRQWTGAPLDDEAAQLVATRRGAGAVIFVSVDKKLALALVLDDQLKEEAPGTIAALRSLGVKPLLLTGDSYANADRAARAAGIKGDDVFPGLLPEEKAELVLRLSHSADAPLSELEEGMLPTAARRGKVAVAFVGDGLNDCPALASAHVGVVLQEVGTAATIDAATAILQASHSIA